MAVLHDRQTMALIVLIGRAQCLKKTNFQHSGYWKGVKLKVILENEVNLLQA